MRNLRVVVGGFLGLLPAGGVAWDYVQYPLGFSQLGCDVYYVEDTGLWPVYQTREPAPAAIPGNVEYLRSVMDDFGFQGRWAYRDAVTDTTHGLSARQVRAVCRDADVFVNVSCSTVMREEYHEIPIRILIDSDPMFTQLQMVKGRGFTDGATSLQALVEAHTHHFTFGENVGAADCLVPLCGFIWRPTRQPICLERWPVEPLPERSTSNYTTVMNWSATGPIEYNGQAWGQKSVEFERLLSLPMQVGGVGFAVAVGRGAGRRRRFPADRARAQGWRVLDADAEVPDWRRYGAFIRRSRGEFGIAKEAYVKAITGWFSCRSACYLASGRPVVAQETGWSRYIESGFGLLPYSDLGSAAEAVRAVEADPAQHARAARAAAVAHFDSQRVLGGLLEGAGA